MKRLSLDSETDGHVICKEKGVPRGPSSGDGRREPPPSPRMKTPDQIETAAPLFALSSNANEPEVRAPKPTILLVEDDRSIRRYLEVILQKAGYTVISAGDGLEAMKAALTTHIDAVITDAIMPHLNGHELCRFLRRQAKLSRVPVILLSGLENAAAPSVAKEDGADIYLAKPVTPQELINCLERLL